VFTCSAVAVMPVGLARLTPGGRDERVAMPDGDSGSQGRKTKRVAVEVGHFPLLELEGRVPGPELTVRGPTMASALGEHDPRFSRRTEFGSTRPSAGGGRRTGKPPLPARIRPWAPEPLSVTAAMQSKCWGVVVGGG
jgi:hypothetical protein